VAGIDCHIGSQITQIAPYLDALDRLLDLVEAVEADGIPIHHVDLGGGLGITYTDERRRRPTCWWRSCWQRMDARGHGHREVLLEPGRSLVGNAGVLLTEVQVPQARRRGKNFCIVDAAMNDLMRPAMYQAWMAIEPCQQRDTPRGAGTWWARCANRATGWAATARWRCEPGDVLAVLSAGAYGMAMASNYNTRPRAAEVMIVDGEPVLIRERERVADLFAGERLLG
jgi:diaminopimelate decarboxylase